MKNQAAFIQAVKSRILEVAPGAEVILYGSRARGDYEDESDWDFLVLVDDGVNSWNLWSLLWEQLFDLQIECKEIVQLQVCGKQKWQSKTPTSFYKNIAEDGIAA